MLALTETSPTIEAPKSAAIRIVVVEDHPFFRVGLTTWISRQPNLLLCGTADSPVAALEAIANHHPDIVLLDLQLREGDGFSLLRALKDWSRQPRVIVLSHKDETIFAERAIRAGASGYVLKDEAVDVMGPAIQEVLAGGIHLSAAMRRQLAHADSSTLNGPIARLRTLYNRELQVLEMLGRGNTTKEIAVDLEISPKTVESYRENLKRKLGVPDSLTLVRLATIWEHDERVL
jgi:DNA-binding NarL/FixJ family response regulator